MVIVCQDELDEILAPLRVRAEVHAKFLLGHAGGQPAGEKGLRAFVEHHLGIAPGSQEFEDVVSRIEKEEIGERKTTPEGGEVDTSDVYQVNVIRRTEHGAYIKDHQIKAMLKQAASRMGLFSAKGKVGSKGDLAEMGTIQAIGDSLQDPDRPWEIYVRNAGQPSGTHFEKLNGSVNTPTGKHSIQHHTEITDEGAEIFFSVEWPNKKLKADDMLLVFAAATQIGLGSCLSLGFGRFTVISMEIPD